MTFPTRRLVPPSMEMMLMLVEVIPKLSDKADAIVGALAGNTNWTTTPTLTQVKTANTALRGFLTVPEGTPGRSRNLHAATALSGLLTALGTKSCGAWSDPATIMVT